MKDRQNSAPTLSNEDMLAVKMGQARVAAAILSAYVIVPSDPTDDFSIAYHLAMKWANDLARSKCDNPGCACAEVKRAMGICNLPLPFGDN